MITVWSRHGHMITIWSQYDHSMVTVWSQYDHSLVTPWSCARRALFVCLAHVVHTHAARGRVEHMGHVLVRIARYICVYNTHDVHEAHIACARCALIYVCIAHTWCACGANWLYATHVVGVLGRSQDDRNMITIWSQYDHSRSQHDHTHGHSMHDHSMIITWS